MLHKKTLCFILALIFVFSALSTVGADSFETTKVLTSEQDLVFDEHAETEEPGQSTDVNSQEFKETDRSIPEIWQSIDDTAFTAWVISGEHDDVLKDMLCDKIEGLADPFFTRLDSIDQGQRQKIETYLANLWESISIQDDEENNSAHCRDKQHNQSQQGERSSDFEGKDVLLIETEIPWDSDANDRLLQTLCSEGLIDGYTKMSIISAAKEDFSDYGMIMIANDQTDDFYDKYELIRESLEDYAYNGGAIAFGACDNGWKDSVFSWSLPGGVTKYDLYSYQNYVSAHRNDLILGTYTDGVALTDDMLNGHYCSHGCFYESTLPTGTVVLLRSSSSLDPTLIDYPFGKGHVIASCLTWEFYYYAHEYENADFSENSFDDYVLYTLHQSAFHSGAPVGSNGKMLPGRDDNHFYHSSSSFFSQTEIQSENTKYFIEDDYFGKLFSYIDRQDSTTKKELIVQRESNWGGSCFGIASTMMLVYLNKLSTKHYTGSKNDVYQHFPMPKDSHAFRSLINYYQLSQYVPIMANYYVTDSLTEENIHRIVDLALESERTMIPFVFCMGYHWDKVDDDDPGSAGHAIVCVGCKQLQDGSYRLEFIDENTYSGNTGKTSYIYASVSPDYSSFAFDSKYTSQEQAKRNRKNWEIYRIGYQPTDSFDLIDIDGNGQTPISKEMILETPGDIISFRSGIEFDLYTENYDLTYIDGEFEGTLPILDIRYIENGEDEEIRLRVEANEWYSVDILSGNSTYFSVSNGDDAFYNYSGENAEWLYFSFDDSIVSAGGYGMDYRIYYAEDEKSVDMVKFTGSGTDDVTISRIKENDEILFCSDNMRGTIVTTYEENDTKDLTISSDNNAVIIAPEDLTYDNISFSLDQEYLILAPGSEVKLIPQYSPTELFTGINWYVTDEDGQTDYENEQTNPVISVDDEGNVYAHAIGTAYVIGYTWLNGRSFTVRCRIDVTDQANPGNPHPIAQQIIRVSLPMDHVAIELYSTDYTKVEILLEMEQLYSAQSDGGLNFQSPIGAVQNAVFQNANTAEAFDLLVKDDRHLLIVPKERTISDAHLGKTIASSFSSPIVLTVDGVDFLTEPLTFTVSQKLPKLKGNAVKLNAFIIGDTAELTITGGVVKALKEDTSNSLAIPNWLKLNSDGFVSIMPNAPQKASGKMYLLADVEGIAVPLPVVVPYSVSTVRPKYTVNPKTVTVMPGTVDTATVKVTANNTVFCDSEVYPITIKEISEGSGKNKKTYENGNAVLVCINGTTITVKPVLNDGKAHTYTITLNGAGVTFSFTVKTLLSKNAVKLDVKQSGMIYTNIKDSKVELTVSMKNFHVGSGEDYIVSVKQHRDKTKDCLEINRNVSFLFRQEWKDNKLYLSEITPGSLPSGFEYYVSVKAKLGNGIQTPEKKLKLKVNWDQKSKHPASATISVKGAVDVIRPGEPCKVIPNVKNYFGDLNAHAWLEFYVTPKGSKVSEETYAFDYYEKDGVFYVYVDEYTDEEIDLAAKYSVRMVLYDSESEVNVCTKPVNLKVTMKSVSLKAAPADLVLLANDRYSAATFELTTGETNLSMIREIRLDAASEKLFTVKHLDGDVYVLEYKDHQRSAGLSLNSKKTVKLSIFYWGNYTEKANATITLKVTIR